MIRRLAQLAHSPSPQTRLHNVERRPEVSPQTSHLVLLVIIVVIVVRLSLIAHRVATGVGAVATLGVFINPHSTACTPDVDDVLVPEPPLLRVRLLNVHKSAWQGGGKGRGHVYERQDTTPVVEYTESRGTPAALLAL